MTLTWSPITVTVHATTEARRPDVLYRCGVRYESTVQAFSSATASGSPGDEYAKLAERVLIEVVRYKVLDYAERHRQAARPHVPLRHAFRQIYRQVQVADHAALDRIPTSFVSRIRRRG